MRRQHNSRYPAKLVHVFGILCCGIAASASASECGSDQILSAYLDPNIPSYGSGKPPPTDLERVLIHAGHSCFREYLLDRREWTSFGCPIEKDIPRIIRTKARNYNVIEYLIDNNFHCIERNKDIITCYYVFRVTITPSLPFSGRLNPDIETTYVTNICISTINPGDIRVKLFKLVRKIHESAEGH